MGDGGILAEVAEKGDGRCGDSHGEQADDQADEQAIAQGLAGHLGIAGAARLGDADGHGHGHADAEHERQVENGVGKGGRRQGHDTEPTDHEGVGQADEHLADLAGDERHGQQERGAAFAQDGGSGETGHGKKTEKRKTKKPAGETPAGLAGKNEIDGRFPQVGPEPPAMAGDMTMETERRTFMEARSGLCGDTSRLPACQAALGSQVLAMWRIG